VTAAGNIFAASTAQGKAIKLMPNRFFASETFKKHQLPAISQQLTTEN